MTARAGAVAGAGRFGRVQVEMLECVHQHRLLSTAQLHGLYRDGLSLRRTQRALGAMEAVGWLASVRQPGGMKLWFVTAAGAEAVEAIGNRAELRRKLIAPAQAAGPLQQHTLAVNEVGVALVRAARERGDEFGPLAWRNEIAHPIGSRRSEAVIADAVLSYERDTPEGVCTHLWFLELDRATMATEALVAKLGRYVDLHHYVAPPSRQRRSTYTGLARWHEQYAHFPSIMVVLANGTRGRLQRRRWLTLARWKSQHGERGRFIDLYICLFEDLIEHGPFAAIFKSNRAEELVDWLGNPAPGREEGEEASEPADDAEQDPPTEPERETEPPEPEPPLPDPPTLYGGTGDRASDRAAAAYDGGAGLLPLPDLSSPDGERDPRGRW